MYKKIAVKLNERVVVFRNGLPKRALAPSRKVLWGVRWGFECGVRKGGRFDAHLAEAGVQQSI